MMWKRQAQKYYWATDILELIWNKFPFLFFQWKHVRSPVYSSRTLGWKLLLQYVSGYEIWILASLHFNNRQLTLRYRCKSALFSSWNWLQGFGWKSLWWSTFVEKVQNPHSSVGFGVGILIEIRADMEPGVASLKDHISVLASFSFLNTDDVVHLTSFLAIFQSVRTIQIFWCNIAGSHWFPFNFMQCKKNNLVDWIFDFAGVKARAIIFRNIYCRSFVAHPLL